MSVALITGSCGLIGAEACRFFADQGFEIVGIDNDLRSYFFGKDASTRWNRARLKKSIPKYTHHSIDIRNPAKLEKIFAHHGSSIGVIIHCAAQPSHDWAAREPFTDFTINANGTLHLLEMTRRYAPDAPFIFTSTNKVYGDASNRFPFVENETRYELAAHHPFYLHGIDETLTVDASTHSLFGASKLAADVLVQEYGRYFGMKTVAFRGGCLTGPGHSGAELHGFLAYLVKCAMLQTPYSVFGHRGKQVRDNIHSSDLVNAFWHFFKQPRVGEIYNIGGSRHSNCSMLEAMAICEKLTGKKIQSTYVDTARKGDHIWWVSDVRKFSSHYPEWQFRYNIEQILQEIHDELQERLEVGACR